MLNNNTKKVEEEIWKSWWTKIKFCYFLSCKPLVAFGFIADGDVPGVFATLTLVVAGSASAWNHVVTPILLNWNVFISPGNCQHDKKFRGKKNENQILIHQKKVWIAWNFHIESGPKPSNRILTKIILKVIVCVCVLVFFWMHLAVFLSG